MRLHQRQSGRGNRTPLERIRSEMPQARATRGECDDGRQSISQQNRLQKERCTLKNNSKRSSLSTGVRLLVMATLVLTLMLGAIQTALAASLAPVNLGKASSFVILSKSGITNVSASKITGDMGVSPIASTAITGFALKADSTNTFSTSTQVTGKIYAANYASPTPANLTTAVSNMEAAYNDAAGRKNPNFTELYAGDLSGKTLVPGLYKWGTSVVANTNVTLKGGSKDIWIFQIAGDLTLALGCTVYAHRWRTGQEHLLAGRRWRWRKSWNDIPS